MVIVVMGEEVRSPRRQLLSMAVVIVFNVAETSSVLAATKTPSRCGCSGGGGRFDGVACLQLVARDDVDDVELRSCPDIKVKSLRVTAVKAAAERERDREDGEGHTCSSLPKRSPSTP